MMPPSIWTEASPRSTRDSRFPTSSPPIGDHMVVRYVLDLRETVGDGRIVGTAPRLTVFLGLKRSRSVMQAR
jgi:hypothetical protein